MKPKELYDLINELAPFSLSEEYKLRGHHDNSGIQLDCGREIEGILFSLDLTTEAVQAAKEAGANCIVTHHPAIWNGVMQLAEGKGCDAVLACLQAGISVISAHLNLDAAEGGIDEWLMKGLGGKKPVAIYEQLTGGRYGHVYDIRECSLKTFVERTSSVFHTKRMVVYGSNPVRRVASFCGAGFESDSVLFASMHGADTVVSSDPKHHLITEAVELGLNLVFLTHYAAENYGFMRFCEAVRQRVSVPVGSFTDERYL